MQDTENVRARYVKKKKKKKWVVYLKRATSKKYTG